jgi:hypothetical protein
MELFEKRHESSYVCFIWIFALGFFLFTVLHKLLDNYPYHYPYHSHEYNMTMSIYYHVKSYIKNTTDAFSRDLSEG